MRQLNSFKKKFDAELFSYLDRKELDLNKLDQRGGDMIKSIKTFLHYGGKRFRPALFYHAYESFAGKKDFDSLQFSFIFELFHTFALIHDDIIDHAELRRGNPTIHTKYGLHMGVLSGDLALTLADEIYVRLLSQSELTAVKIAKTNKLYNAYKQELLVGQYLDCIHLDDRKKIMRLKTADYSFVKPALFALLFADKDKNVMDEWQTFLTRLGIVFQLKDDYDGIFSDEKKTGKSSLSDTQEGKNTYVVELFRQYANQSELDRFHSFFGKEKIPQSDFKWYLRLLEAKNIKHDVTLQIQKECGELKRELENMIQRDTSFRSLIQEIIIYINTF